VWGSCVYNGNLYASGNFENADGNQALAIAKWNGSAWSDVGGGFQHGAISNVVRGLIEFNGELIAGGYVDSAGGVPIHKVAKWNGTGWSPMGMDCPISTVNCFTIHNGELYAGGQGSGAVKVCVAKWTGTNWLALDTEGGNINVWALASYNGQLYAGGNFTNFNNTGAGGVAKWNGTTWSDIGSGVSAVNALAVFQNKLFIGGSFTTAGGIPANNIVSWDGATTWSALAGGTNTQVQSLLSNGTKLFAGGSFWMVNSSTTNANGAAYWDGSTWTVLGTDLGTGGKTICIYNNELYYGGTGAFNGQHYFAKWSGGNFPNSIVENEIQSLEIFPNPAISQLTVRSSEFGDKKIELIEIYDIVGKKVFSQPQTSNFKPQTISIDISKLENGIYFLTANKNSVTVKFIVQH
jgi:hypothetical protein